MGKQNQLILDDNCYCGKYNQFSYYFKVLYISLKLYFLIDINSGNFLINTRNTNDRVLNLLQPEK